MRTRLERLGQYGRVLLLLDACRSGAATGSIVQAPNANVLEQALKSINNVTVLTSSQADKLSRECPTRNSVRKIMLLRGGE